MYKGTMNRGHESIPACMIVVICF